MRNVSVKAFSSQISRLFNEDGTEVLSVNNSDIFPKYLTPWRNGELYILNPNSSFLGEDSQGQLENGWNRGKRNYEKINELIDAYPRHMLKNLLLISGEDGSPLPIAGSYFVKMMDHVPGTVVPNSCLITDENGEITDLKVNGTLTLNGSPIGSGGGSSVGSDSFKTISVSGQSNVVADSPTDTLTLIAGSNITITTDATTDSITISSSTGNIVFDGGNTTVGGTNFTVNSSSTMTLGTAPLTINSNTINMPNVTNITMGTNSSVVGIGVITPPSINNDETLYIMGNLIVKGYIETDVGLRGNTNDENEYLGTGMTLDGGEY
jgi:hypothetical protein